MKIQRLLCTCHPETCPHCRFELVLEDGTHITDSESVIYLEKLVKKLQQEVAKLNGESI